MSNGIYKTDGGWKKLWRRFLSENRGAAALEFAFVVPFLLLIYLLAMEFSLAIEVDKKVSRVASQVADLVTQQPSISENELSAIMRIGESSLQPFRGDPKITVTAIEVTTDDEPEARVVWSRKWDGGDSTEQALTQGSKTAIPEALMVPGAFLIRSHTKLDYWPVIAPDGSSILGFSDDMFPIPMGEHYYMQPRMTHWIECDDC